MKKQAIRFTIILFFILPGLSFAQLRQDTQVNMAKALTQPTKIQSIVGLLGLDPAKFSMKQSYTLSFASIGGHSISQGLYLNTIGYQLSDPLSMYVRLGFIHQPFGKLTGDFQTGNQLFISGAGFEYNPSKNLKLQFEYSKTPGYNNYSPYPPSYLQPLDALHEQDKDKQ